MAVTYNSSGDIQCNLGSVSIDEMFKDFEWTYEFYYDVNENQLLVFCSHPFINGITIYEAKSYFTDGSKNRIFYNAVGHNDLVMVSHQTARSYLIEELNVPDEIVFSSCFLTIS
jgi:hypothetical protein